ncbi:hypothetical protein [Streptomyces sp. H27-S2]|uniref:hypothetical protein n=1 Tax=Streptomyces antarcticus TaxID=2996458 RepID=UPI00226ED950|nr:hypothetical protein [Streptomyces sp. H27-S2]MCY0953347.1 hypothetical protein [Streptomyces sp. H27-S2]
MPARHPPHGGLSGTQRAQTAGVAAEAPFVRRVLPLDAPGAASPYGGFTTDTSGCHCFPPGSVGSPPDRALARNAGQVAFFLLSGTAAPEPLPVPRTHDDFAYQARAAAELVPLSEDDVYLAALPAVSGLVLGSPGIVGTLSLGGTVVLAEDPGPDRRGRASPTPAGGEETPPSVRTGSPERPRSGVPPPGHGECWSRA